MATEITTLDKVKTRLGITNSSKDDALTLIVDAVNERIPLICGRNFTYTFYSEDVNTQGTNIASVSNYPVSQMYYTGAGKTQAITITYEGSNLGSVDVIMDMGLSGVGKYKVVLMDGISNTESINISLSDTMADLASAIDALPSWSAFAQSDVDIYPALALIAGTYQTMKQSTNQIFLYAPLLAVRAKTLQTARGEYTLNSSGCSNPLKMIYQGGYEQIPADLCETATDIAVNVYRESKRDQGLQSERIGNYSWTAKTGNYLTEVLPAYYSQLSNYKNPILA